MNESNSLRSNIEIISASLEQKPVLANLLELYSHDFCDYIDLEIGPDGRFGYLDLDLYWTDPDRLPFLLYVAGRLAGFILIKASHRDAQGSMVWDVAEFFILRSYRRRGIGTETAHQLWRRFPRRWEVRGMATNERAYRFWHHAIESFSGDAILATRFSQGGGDWRRFSFESRPSAQDSGGAGG